MKMHCIKPNMKKKKKNQNISAWQVLSSNISDHVFFKFSSLSTGCSEMHNAVHFPLYLAGDCRKPFLPKIEGRERLFPHEDLCSSTKSLRFRAWDS